MHGSPDYTAPGPAGASPRTRWVHALNAARFRPGSVFGWWEDGALLSGIVVSTDTFSVEVKDIRPGVLAPRKPRQP